ncbi:MAG: dephospho-CoA kinase, partial [Deltaproteobacteria bacterium RIFOXYD12_FULL_57_12]
MPARGANDERVDVIGLTGGIGSGKSLAAAFLARQTGWQYIDADQICRQLVEPEAPGWKLLGDVFGARFFHDDQTLNRTLLRQAIFNDPGLRAQVNSLLHPLARQRVASMVAGRSTAFFPASGALGTVLVEVPLLFEAGWERDF